MPKLIWNYVKKGKYFVLCIYVVSLNFNSLSIFSFQPKNLVYVKGTRKYWNDRYICKKFAAISLRYTRSFCTRYIFSLFSFERRPCPPATKRIVRSNVLSSLTERNCIASIWLSIPDCNTYGRMSLLNIEWHYSRFCTVDLRSQTFVTVDGIIVLPLG